MKGATTRDRTHPTTHRATLHLIRSPRRHHLRREPTCGSTAPRADLRHELSIRGMTCGRPMMIGPQRRVHQPERYGRKLGAKFLVVAR